MGIVCLGGTRKAYTAAKVVDDGSEASDSSGVPLSEKRYFPPRANHEKKLTGRQLSAHYLQRGRKLQRSEPQRRMLRLELTGAARTHF
jgi:hypothetical protein